jgi:glutathione S-transferase
MASHIVLNELNLPFELVLVDGASKRFSAGKDYRVVNPLGYVPTLELDDGARLNENPALLIYLASLGSERDLAPATDALGAARLHELLAFLSSELHKAFSPFFASPAIAGAAREAAVARLDPRLDQLEQRLADGREYLLGGAFTVADAFAFVILGWTAHAGLTLDRRPLLAAFMERIGRRPSVGKALRAEGLVAEAA